MVANYSVIKISHNWWHNHTCNRQVLVRNGQIPTLGECFCTRQSYHRSASEGDATTLFSSFFSLPKWWWWSVSPVNMISILKTGFRATYEDMKHPCPKHNTCQCQYMAIINPVGNCPVGSILSLLRCFQIFWIYLIYKVKKISQTISGNYGVQTCGIKLSTMNFSTSAKAIPVSSTMTELFSG